MESPTEILPGVLFYSYLSKEKKERPCLWNHHTIILQVSGSLTLETAGQNISVEGPEILLIGKNQLGTLIKTPVVGGNYETIVISLQEDALRKIALEEKYQSDRTYTGLPNTLIPLNEFLQGYFQSVIPYARKSGTEMTDELGILKMKEVVKLLLHAQPELMDFLFDFSQPCKIDLEKFMLNNFRFNIPVQQFAQLTGRSLAGFKRDFKKIFGLPPRQWLLDKRLAEAKYLIGTKKMKPSDIYLDLGFQSLPHFSRSFKIKFGVPPNRLVSDMES